MSKSKHSTRHRIGNAANPKPEKEREPYLTSSLKIIPLLEIILAGIGLYYLGFADGGILGWMKLTIFCAAAYAVAYAIYRMAIEKGVPLVAAGSKLAGPLSGLSIALVGLAFFAVTAPGLTMSQVEEARLASHLEEVDHYVDGRVSVADQTAEVVPMLQSITQDMQDRTEEESSTGFGPITRALNALQMRADGLAKQMKASLGVRQEVLDRIRALRLNMETTLADEFVSIWVRRAMLRRQQADLLSQLSELDKAVPVSIVRSYASELQGGVLIPNRQDANARINQTLNGYSNTLMAALADQRGVAGNPPTFPSKTGALDTFQYIGKFAPIFLFAFIVDMAFPLALWAYVLMTMIAHTPQVWAKPRKDTDLDRLTTMRSISARRMNELMDYDGDSAGLTDVQQDRPMRPHTRPAGKTRN